jgi:hypothetical protein
MRLNVQFDCLSCGSTLETEIQPMRTGLSCSICGSILEFPTVPRLEVVTGVFDRGLGRHLTALKTSDAWMCGALVILLYVSLSLWGSLPSALMRAGVSLAGGAFLTLAVAKPTIMWVRALWHRRVRCPHRFVILMNHFRCGRCLFRIERRGAEFRLVPRHQRVAADGNPDTWAVAARKDVRDAAATIRKAWLSELDGLLRLDPGAFEDLVDDFLRAEGFHDTLLERSRGPAGRLLLQGPDGPALVETRRVGKRVAIPGDAVEALVAAIADQEAEEGWFVTTGRFAPAARELIEEVPVRLVDGMELARFRHELAGAGSYTYGTRCTSCGMGIELRFGDPPARCPHGHPLEVVLTEQHLDSAHATRPGCPKCGRTMHLRGGREGRVWRCAGYPRCTHTKQYERPGSKAKRRPQRRKRRRRR